MSFIKTGGPETGQIIVSGDYRDGGQPIYASDEDIKALFEKEDDDEDEDKDAADGE